MDPIICLAKCFSSWSSIQVLMGLVLAWLLILIGLSGWLTEYDGGTLATVDVGGQKPYSDFANSICGADPYKFLVPFSFGYTSTSYGSSTSPSYCGFQTNNSVFRLVICATSFVTVLLLFFSTPLSLVARPIFFVYAMLFYASAVLDINSVYTGYSTCTANFVNTDFENFVTSNGISLNCQPGSYAGVCVIDLIVSGQFFFLYTTWLLCKDRYLSKSDTTDQKTLLRTNNKV